MTLPSITSTMQHRRRRDGQPKMDIRRLCNGRMGSAGAVDQPMMAIVYAIIALLVVILRG